MAEHKPIERLPPKPDAYIWRVDRQRMLRAEIDGAVSAFFEGNNIAARVLTWAALDVMRPIAESQGIQTFHGNLEDWINEEYLRSWRSLLRADYNFFKHSDRDPEAVIDDYRPEATALMLLGAVADYGSIYKKHTLRMAAFKAWVFGRFPNVLKPDAKVELQRAIAALPDSSHSDFEQSLITTRDHLRLYDVSRDDVLAAIPDELKGQFEDF